jgi:hypothetical protein
MFLRAGPGSVRRQRFDHNWQAAGEYLKIGNTAGDISRTMYERGGTWPGSFYLLLSNNVSSPETLKRLR